MIPVLAFAAGFALGWHRARRSGGNRLDKLQYGAAHGIAGAILGMIVLIALARLQGA